MLLSNEAFDRFIAELRLYRRMKDVSASLNAAGS